jgi:L-amino acid N-acyltransferase YncA
MTPSTQALIRRALADDAAAICAVYNTAIEERGSTFETELRTAADFSDRIGTDHFPFLVAEDADKVLGWAGVSSYSSRPCYSGVGECSVYVSPDARERGIGTALTKALAAEAERNDFHKLLGKLFTDNTASIRLCERCDFVSVGTHRRHGQLDGAWRDVLVMERLLATA